MSEHRCSGCGGERNGTGSFSHNPGCVYAPRTCTVEGCAVPARARGMCQKHYDRVRRYGDPVKFIPRGFARWDREKLRALTRVAGTRAAPETRPFSRIPREQVRSNGRRGGTRKASAHWALWLVRELRKES